MLDYLPHPTEKRGISIRTVFLPETVIVGKRRVLEPPTQ